jgi:hypothetical protein
VSYNRWSVLGWSLYGASWVTPDLKGDRFGVQAFWAAVRYGMGYLFQPDSLSALALGLCLLLGWCANFSIFIPCSPAARRVWMAAPWLPFAGVLLLLHVPFAVREQVLLQLYFYPWAVGIALIHAAKMVETQRRQ